MCRMMPYDSVCVCVCVWLFPRLRGVSKNVRQFIPRLRFFFFSFFFSFFFFSSFFQVEVRLRTLVPLLSPGSINSGSTSWDDCGWVFQTRCVWTRFLIGSHTTSTQRQSQPTPTSLGQGWFRCNLATVLLAEWPEFFTCHCGTTEVERTQNKSQHTKLTLEKKILQPLLPEFELATFRSRVRRSTTRVWSGIRFTYGRTYNELTLRTYLAKYLYSPDWVADPAIVFINVWTRFGPLTIESSWFFVWCFALCDCFVICVLLSVLCIYSF